MKLSQDRLNAFYEAYRCNSITKAAKQLGITQSAMSHRIKNLEEELQLTLFDREPTGLRLTSSGEKLLLYCHNQIQIEEEFLNDLCFDNFNEIAGVIRIGSSSSLAWSAVTPSLGELIRSNSGIYLDLIAKEVKELPTLFQRGRVDFLISSIKLSSSGVVEHELGKERYVLIEPTRKKHRIDIYLDHHEEDTFTQDFLKIQKNPPSKYKRSFMDDNHGLIAGVKEGFGRAVVPHHIVKKVAGIQISKKYKTLESPIYLYYRKQPYYTKLHHAVVDCFLSKIPQVLA